MQFIINGIVALLVAYLAFTNALAEQLIKLFSVDISPSVHEEKTGNSLSALPTKHDRFRLPNILLKSAEYQQAALGAAFSEPKTVEDPLLALVNIYCTFVTRKHIRTTTGTGFFVHQEGVVMTSAHVAQFLLLETTDVLGDANCAVRTGNPAMPKYRAELLYMPPAWVSSNAAMIDVAAPTGTGERDYALLYIAASVDGSPLPEVFPALAFDVNPLPREAKEETVRIAGYPATELLSRRGGLLAPQVATTTISNLYTFSSNLVDVFSVRGSAVGAGGSSGGPVINEEGRVIGMIATRGDDARDGKGSLRAITLSHVNRTIVQETGFSLERNVSGNLQRRADIFRQTLAPFLLTLLTTELAN
jgi:hypothetical protein